MREKSIPNYVIAFRSVQLLSNHFKKILTDSIDLDITDIYYTYL